MNFDVCITPNGDSNFSKTSQGALSFLYKLSEEQRDAVRHNSTSSIISAGAGSGKTRVLTYKIAYLISVGVSPSKILALTFTNKAANEMKSRVIKLLDNHSIKEIWMGTFHSIFLRILRENYEYLHKKYNLSKKFLIYDQKSKNTVLEMIIEKYIIDFKNAKRINNRIVVQKIISEISDDISKIKNEGKSIDECLSYDSNLDLNKYSKEYIKNIYKDYCQKCINSNALDFDDILLFTYIMFKENKEIADKYRNKFEFILVDEYQDTNSIQFNIIDLIHGKNSKICVVGDDAQCIYSFRGSKIENIKKFIELYKPMEFRLTMNYRSTKTIVEASNKLIQNNGGQNHRILFTNSEKNQLIENKIKIISAQNNKEEAKKVIETIIDLRNKDKKENNWGSFAILYRVHKQSEPFESELKNSGIPYEIFGKVNFLETEIIVLIISYLKIIINEKDNISLQKIFNFSFSDISLKIKKLFDKADKNKTFYWKVINNLEFSKNGIYEKVKSFIEFVNLLKIKIGFEEPCFFIKKIVDFIKSNKSLVSFQFDPENEKLIESLMKMTSFLTKKFKDNIEKNQKNKSEKKIEDDDLINNKDEIDLIFENIINEKNDKTIAIYSLEEFLDDLILLNTNEDLSENLNNDSVKLMTIHSAKGLEFNSVFIVGVEKGNYPLSHPSVKNETKHKEEERRMFYVAITRAKQNCFITYAQNKLMANGKFKKREKSIFISELEDKCLDFSGDIIKNNYKNDNDDYIFSFNESAFNHRFKDNFNSLYNSRSNSKNYNYSYKEKNKKSENYFKKSKSNSFLNRKRNNNF